MNGSVHAPPPLIANRMSRVMVWSQSFQCKPEQDSSIEEKMLQWASEEERSACDGRYPSVVR